MVHVTVTVLDSGKFVTGLPREAFRVFEDDVQQTINYFAAETSPLELVVGVDVSGSLGAGDRSTPGERRLLRLVAPSRPTA